MHHQQEIQVLQNGQPIQLAGPRLITQPTQGQASLDASDRRLKSELKLLSNDLRFFSEVISEALDGHQLTPETTTNLLEFFSMAESSCSKAKSKLENPANVSQTYPLSSLRSLSSVQNPLGVGEIPQNELNLAKLKNLKTRFQNIRQDDIGGRVSPELEQGIQDMLSIQKELISELQKFEIFDNFRKVLEEFIRVNKSLVFVVSSQFTPIRHNQYLLRKDVKKVLFLLDELGFKKEEELKRLRYQLRVRSRHRDVVDAPLKGHEVKEDDFVENLKKNQKKGKKSSRILKRGVMSAGKEGRNRLENKASFASLARKKSNFSKTENSDFSPKIQIQAFVGCDEEEGAGKLRIGRIEEIGTPEKLKLGFGEEVEKVEKKWTKGLFNSRESMQSSSESSRSSKSYTNMPQQTPKSFNGQLQKSHKHLRLEHLKHPPILKVQSSRQLNRISRHHRPVEDQKKKKKVSFFDDKFGAQEEESTGIYDDIQFKGGSTRVISSLVVNSRLLRRLDGYLSGRDKKELIFDAKSESDFAVFQLGWNRKFVVFEDGEATDYGSLVNDYTNLVATKHCRVPFYYLYNHSLGVIQKKSSGGLKLEEIANHNVGTRIGHPSGQRKFMKLSVDESYLLAMGCESQNEIFGDKSPKSINSDASKICLSRAPQSLPGGSFISIYSVRSSSEKIEIEVSSIFNNLKNCAEKRETRPKSPLKHTLSSHRDSEDDKQPMRTSSLKPDRRYPEVQNELIADFIPLPGDNLLLISTLGSIRVVSVELGDLKYRILGEDKIELKSTENEAEEVHEARLSPDGSLVAVSTSIKKKGVVSRVFVLWLDQGSKNDQKDHFSPIRIIRVSDIDLIHLNFSLFCGFEFFGNCGPQTDSMPINESGMVPSSRNILLCLSYVDKKGLCGVVVETHSEGFQVKMGPCCLQESPQEPFSVIEGTRRCSDLVRVESGLITIDSSGYVYLFSNTQTHQ